MYKYKVYYEGSWLHEENDFETHEEAMEDAKLYVESKIECWEADGVDWEDLFNIEVEEM